MKYTLSQLRKADERFHMIEEGDRIAVGLSGGKDSALLLHALSVYQKFSRKKYELTAICVDLGFGLDESALADLCRTREIPLEIVHTEIGRIVFEERKEKNPCALCAKLRKGAFYRVAKELSCNKAAFAHHADDVSETFLMSLIYERRINTFTPVTYLSRQDVTLVRPFVLLEESHIRSTAKKLGLQVVKNACPSCGNTKREEMKRLLDALSLTYPDIRKSLKNAISKPESYHLWDVDESKNE